MANAIKLSNYDIKPDAKVVVSGTLRFGNITSKNQNTKFTPTYGVTLDNPTYSTPDKQGTAAYTNDVHLAQFLVAHEKREEARHSKDRLHLTWKDGGKLHGTHMPIAGLANQNQLQAVDAGNLLAKRNDQNQVLGKDGQPATDAQGQPTTDVNKVPKADKTVAFDNLASGQPVKVTYVTFGSKNFGGRLGSTIRALVVKDRDNLDLYSGESSVAQFGLVPGGDQTNKIQINADSNENAAETGKAAGGNPFAPKSSSANTGSANKGAGNNQGNKPASKPSNGGNANPSKGNKAKGGSKDPNDDDLPF